MSETARPSLVEDRTVGLRRVGLSRRLPVYYREVYHGMCTAQIYAEPAVGLRSYFQSSAVWLYQQATSKADEYFYNTER